MFASESSKTAAMETGWVRLNGPTSFAFARTSQNRLLASILALRQSSAAFHTVARKMKSGRGLPQSKTLSRRTDTQADNPREFEPPYVGCYNSEARSKGGLQALAPFIPSGQARRRGAEIRRNKRRQ